MRRMEVAVEGVMYYSPLHSCFLRPYRSDSNHLVCDTSNDCTYEYMNECKVIPIDDKLCKVWMMSRKTGEFPWTMHADNISFVVCDDYLQEETTGYSIYLLQEILCF